MKPLKILYLARDTDGVTLFENPPVREITENSFYFIDTKSGWFSDVLDQELKEKIKIGDVIEIPLYPKSFFETLQGEINLLKNYISQ